jgi:spore maturation protein CgeB
MRDTLRILFVNTATSFSIGDVARGYKAALIRQGHEVQEYHLAARMVYHRKAIPAEFATTEIVAKHASETILNEAVYWAADLVVIISGLMVHPICLWLLGRVGIPVAVVLTESPYDDESQAKWVDLTHIDNTALDITVFTNDRFSALKYGWHFLPPSFDPMYHHPTDPDPDLEGCDVLMVGTGWPERIKFLEAIDWTGIDIRLFGTWHGVAPESPLFPYVHSAIVNNAAVPAMYCAAKINLNIHRASDVALTPGPRAYELAACGAFQLSDSREDLASLFGEGVPTFRTPEELGDMVRYYLAKPEERRLCAAKSLDAVCDEDFDKRAAALIATVGSNSRLLASVG